MLQNQDHLYLCLLYTSALGLSLASAAALAQGAFIGIEGDYSFNSKLTAKSDNGKSKVKKAQPGIGLKAGYDFDSFRVYGAYIYDFQAKKSLGDEDGTVIKWSTHKFIVGADLSLIHISAPTHTPWQP